MNWQTPKTDWEVKPYVNGRYQGDWFDYIAYNRILDNLRHLYILGSNVYSVTFAFLTLTNALLNSVPTERTIQDIEDALYTITQNTYTPPTYPGKSTWAGDGPAPDYNDLNRIESACAALKEHFESLATRKTLVPSGATSFVTVDGNTFTVL